MNLFQGHDNNHSIKPATPGDIAFAKSLNIQKIAGVSVTHIASLGIFLFWAWVAYLIFGIVGGLEAAGTSYIVLLVGLFLLGSALFYGECVFRDKYDSLSLATEKWLMKGTVLAVDETHVGRQIYWIRLENDWTVMTTRCIYSMDRIFFEKDAKSGEDVSVELLVNSSLRNPLSKYPRYEVVRAEAA